MAKHRVAKTPRRPLPINGGQKIGLVGLDPGGLPYALPFEDVLAAIGGGDVSGDPGALDNQLARFNGNGHTIQGGLVREEDDGRLVNLTDPVDPQDAATKAYVDLFASAAGVAHGIIAHWAPALGAIPAGWALCDGTLGTPNLIDLFVV